VNSGTLLIAGVRPWGRPTCDILISDGVIAEVGPSGGLASPGQRVLDGRGLLALPSFSDVHAHLDSTRLGLPFRPHTARPGLLGLITNDLQNWRSAEESVADRATRTLGLTIASGATLIRSHAQVDSYSGLERFEGVIAAREAHAGRALVQVVAFPQAGIVRDPGTAELLEKAVAGGADLVGGIDPCALDRDPARHLDTVFGIAERHGVGIDIHLHEPGELGAFTIELVCERVRALGLQGKTTISHCFALATLPGERAQALAERLAELDIALTTIAPSGQRVLPAELLSAAGLRLGLGQDGLRDYWSPFGDGDMLGRTWQLAFTQQLRRDDQIERAVAIATVGGRSVVDPGYSAARWTDPTDSLPGFGAGEPADLVLLPGETVTSAVMDRPKSRIVLHRGTVVAMDGALVGAG
jgi:cytosine/adenosine deaminase-related metal-dependent hydrolase